MVNQSSVSSVECPEVSYIIPMMNEEDNVLPMLSQLYDAGVITGRSFEMVVVDDGSTDDTYLRLKQATQQYPILKVVEMRRNYGQTAAMAAGFAYATGKYFVTLDGDLQNNPHDALKMLEQLEHNHLDVVAGWRQGRQDAAISRKLPSWLANRLIAWLTGVYLHDYGCSLKVYRAEIAKDLSMYGEMHRFIPALAAMEGARILEWPVSHRARQFGVSKYNLSRTAKVVLDLMTVVMMKRFWTRPLHLFGRLGFGLLLVSMGILGYLFVCKLSGASIGQRPLLLCACMMALSSVQLICTGLLAEIQVRTYHESQNKPIYRVRTLLGF
ncbi:MAG: glycosyltransferase family 2 protein [Vampirovibrionales bacterium]